MSSNIKRSGLSKPTIPSRKLLLTLIGASIGASLGAVIRSFQELLRCLIPNFTFIRKFFSAWFKLDITTLAAALTIYGTLSGVLQDVKGIASKVQPWFTNAYMSSISIEASDRLNKEVLQWLLAQVYVVGKGGWSGDIAEAP